MHSDRIVAATMAASATAGVTLFGLSFCWLCSAALVAVVSAAVALVAAVVALVALAPLRLILLPAVQQTLCQGFNGVNTTILQGFNGVDNAICTLGYQQQAGVNALSTQLAQCCCDTQRAIDGVNYNMATQFCGLNNTIQNTTRDIIDSQNAGTRAILDFLVQEKLSTKDARIAALEGQLGRAEQNGVIRAAIDASTAEIIRRTGNDCPVPSYLVQPPTPVNFPVNGCGTVQFGGYGGCGNNCGCGCGCS